MKTRTIVSEEKYKKYINKLAAILRRCEKQYFTELLEINKGNLKETWKILNGLINKKNSKGKQISTEFNGDESKITGDKTIANGFNTFFVNIGPSLAKRIPKSKDSFTQFLPDKIEDTMFLQPVTEEEIMQQVKNAKNLMIMTNLICF